MEFFWAWDGVELRPGADSASSRVESPEVDAGINFGHDGISFAAMEAVTAVMGSVERVIWLICPQPFGTIRGWRSPA